MTRPTAFIAPYPTITAFEHHDSERTHRFPTNPLPDGPLLVTTRGEVPSGDGVELGQRHVPQPRLGP